MKGPFYATFCLDYTKGTYAIYLKTRSLAQTPQGIWHTGTPDCANFFQLSGHSQKGDFESIGYKYQA